MEKNNTHPSKPDSNGKENNGFPGYSVYLPEEDIFNNAEEETLNSEGLDENKTSGEKPGKWNEKDFNEDASGSDLDVPGSELDDDQEKIGSEDEENNYYSIGGDDHENLDEDKGDWFFVESLWLSEKIWHNNHT